MTRQDALEALAVAARGVLPHYEYLLSQYVASDPRLEHLRIAVHDLEQADAEYQAAVTQVLDAYREGYRRQMELIARQRHQSNLRECMRPN